MGTVGMQRGNRFTTVSELPLTLKTRELPLFLEDPQAAKESGVLPLKPPMMPASAERNWKR